TARGFLFWQTIILRYLSGACFAAHSWAMSPLTSVGPCNELKLPAVPPPMYPILRFNPSPSFSLTGAIAFTTCTPYGHCDITYISSVGAEALAAAFAGAAFSLEAVLSVALWF